MPETYERSDCRLCRSTQLEPVIELTPTPPGNQFLTADEMQVREEIYDLTVMHCGTCSHLQLGLVVDPEILYRKDYKYVSGTSPVFVQHFADYADWVSTVHNLTPGGLVVDIGSNDGTCLRAFKDRGFDVLGVDPATEIAAEATANGIPTWGEFFAPEVADRIVAEHGHAALVTTHNACAHIDDLEGVVLGAKHVMDDDGLFVCEVGYAVDVYDKAYFDTIYHEHLDYHTVGPFQAFFARLGMRLVDVLRLPVQGGSIRLVVRKSIGKSSPHRRVAEALQLEANRGFDDPDTFRAFSRRVADVGAELRRVIRDLVANGARVAAYGAPTKSTTLLTHFGIGRNEISYIVDDNPKKQGLFTPLTHIPVVDPLRLTADRPDYMLLLAWNFAEPIMAKNQEFAAAGGRFILPMPDVQII